ncbi:ATP-dependent rna [Cyclospora cayetanensis]|uniref:ATP-dependent rna n=1 Tax=Cyclospora cayetanensis TaxID=88456 RepID=A0A1D3D167_9EIME|nr:ATP-dependent rna [Cyclospora cayetanensis]
MKAKKAKKASSEGLGQAEGAPRGLPLWRAVDVEPGLEAEGFLGLEELVYEEEAKPRGEKRKRDRSQQRGQAQTDCSPRSSSTHRKKKKAKNPQQQRGTAQEEIAKRRLEDSAAASGRTATQTGSGKTLAFALPIVSSLATQLARRLEKWQERQTRKEAEEQQERATAEAFLEHHEGGPEADPAVREEQRRQFLLQQVQPEGPAALVLEPTRELALQVLHVLQQLCTYTPIRAAAVVGGLSPEKQLRVLGTSKPLILVATPGRLLALQREQPLSVAASEAASEALGVGKVDDQGEDEEEENEDPQNQRKQQGLQVISASSQDDEDGSAAAAALLQHVRIRAKMLVAVRVSEAEQQQHVWRHQLQEQEPQTEGQKESAVELQQLNSKLPSTLRLSVWKCPVESEMEVHLAAYLLRVFDLKAGEKQPLRVVLFVNAISYVYRLESLLTLLLQEQLQQRHKAQIAVCGLHSNLQQKQRLKRLDRFLSSRYGLLVSTDVAARGVDFKDVEKVLHFQRPRDQETFIHRCGRTARAGKDGEAVCFISSSASGVWEWLLASAGIQLSAAPPPLGFRDIAGLQERMETIRRLFQLADQVERENHQEQKQKRKRGVMRRLALAADVELESDGSAADEALQDLRIKGQRKNQQARQKLRQASVFTDSAQAIEVDVLQEKQKACKGQQNQLRTLCV